MARGSFAIIAGDARSQHLGEMLRKRGCAAVSFGLERAPRGECPRARSLRAAISGAGYVVLPMRMTGEGGALNAPLAKAPIELSELLPLCPKSALVFGGVVSPEAADCAAAFGREILDYGRRDELQILNAIPTALDIHLVFSR